MFPSIHTPSPGNKANAFTPHRIFNLLKDYSKIMSIPVSATAHPSFQNYIVSNMRELKSTRSMQSREQHNIELLTNGSSSQLQTDEAESAIHEWKIKIFWDPSESVWRGGTDPAISIYEDGRSCWIFNQWKRAPNTEIGDPKCAEDGTLDFKERSELTRASKSLSGEGLLEPSPCPFCRCSSPVVSRDAAEQGTNRFLTRGRTQQRVQDSPWPLSTVEFGLSVDRRPSCSHFVPFNQSCQFIIIEFTLTWNLK